MTEAEQITHLKAQLAERDEAIRELNERASSHLITMMNTVQRLKLENDVAMAKLRGVGHYKILMEADKQVERQRVAFEKAYPDIEPYDLDLLSRVFVIPSDDAIICFNANDPLASTKNQS